MIQRYYLIGRNEYYDKFSFPYWCRYLTIPVIIEDLKLCCDGNLKGYLPLGSFYIFRITDGAVTRNFPLSTTSVTEPFPWLGTHKVNMWTSAIPTFKFCGTLKVVSNGNRGLTCPQNEIRRMKDFFLRFDIMTSYFRLGPFEFVRIRVRVRL